MDLPAPITGTNGSTRQNYREFAELVRKQLLLENHIFVLYDVVSLFTTVPTDLAVEVASAQLKEGYNLEPGPSFTIDDIMLKLSICLNWTHFVFVF